MGWCSSEGVSVRLVLKARFGEAGNEADEADEAELTHSYEIQVGLREPFEAAFTTEPLVKEERLTVRQGKRDVTMMERRGQLVTLRNEESWLRAPRRWGARKSQAWRAALRDRTSILPRWSALSRA